MLRQFYSQFNDHVSTTIRSRHQNNPKFQYQLRKTTSDSGWSELGSECLSEFSVPQANPTGNPHPVLSIILSLSPFRGEEHSNGTIFQYRPQKS